MSEPRWELIKHIRDQIARDPESYANAAKLRCCLDKLGADLTGQSESRSLLPHQEATHDDARAEDTTSPGQ